MTDLLKLSNRIMLRKEHFGGILFNRDTGDLIEVDREAFTVISIIKDFEVVDMKILLNLLLFDKGRRIDRGKIKTVLSGLKAMGIIKVMPNGVLSEDYRKMLGAKSLIKLKWPMYVHLSAPETIHWAVTFQCDEACPDCYIERHKRSFASELDTQNALKLVDKIADSGAFQLAIGGGEPFIRDDLENIVRSASRRGLTVHITTGKYQIERNRLDALAEHIKTLQIGIRIDELLCKSTYTAEKLRLFVNRLNDRNIITGANLIMAKSAIQNFDEIMKMLISIGFKRYTLLRYKPPGNVKRWLQEKPDKHDLDLLEERLAVMQEMHRDLFFRIDCALSFLERRLNPQTALYLGIRGCVAGERIISIAPDGSVYPCSQLVGNIFNAGNLLNEDFESIWNQSSVIKKYRGFREKKSFKNGNCGKCQAKAFCGGCRVFAADTIGADPGCPGPLCDSKHSDDGYDLIADIQDTIGCTGWGFPYATREEIEKWLEEDNQRDYPSWINNR
jgi:radical SAM protein with 4Fe4S-binding SPASM domain